MGPLYILESWWWYAAVTATSGATAMATLMDDE